MTTDFQRNKCYAWEDVHIHRRGGSIVKPENAQAIIDYVWEGEGLKYPPKIKVLPAQCRRKQAKGNRLNIWIPKAGIETTILLHELAHSLTSTYDGASAHHNGRFVGVFMQLLSKYAGFDINELMVTARSAGVEFNFKGKVL